MLHMDELATPRHLLQRVFQRLVRRLLAQEYAAREVGQPHPVLEDSDHALELLDLSPVPDLDEDLALSVDVLDEHGLLDGQVDQVHLVLHAVEFDLQPELCFALDRFPRCKAHASDQLKPFRFGIFLGEPHHV